MSMQSGKQNHLNQNAGLICCVHIECGQVYHGLNLRHLPVAVIWTLVDNFIDIAFEA